MTTRQERSQAVDEAITSATLDLLREQGYRGLTVLAVIERSGVSSATLYRRWPTKQALVAAAFGTLTPSFDDVDTGTLAGDLDVVAKQIGRAIVERDDLGVLSIELQQDEELRALSRSVFTEPRLRQVAAVLDRAVERGELTRRPSPELVHSLLGGPLYHRLVLLDGKLSPSFLRTVVRAVLAGLEATPPR